MEELEYKDKIILVMKKERKGFKRDISLCTPLLAQPIA
jgi:hypothetical protein